MKRRVAALLASVVGLAVVLMFPSPASASASQFEIAPTGKVSSEGGFVTISVTYQCTPSEPVNIEVQVAQSRGLDLVRGFGILFGFCSSSPQTTLFIVSPRFEDSMPFGPGPADVIASDMDTGAFTGPVTVRLTR